jgi:hypothetical protein
MSRERLYDKNRSSKKRRNSTESFIYQNS